MTKTRVNMYLLLHMTVVYLCLTPCILGYGHVTLDQSEAKLDYNSGLYCSIQKVRMWESFQNSKFIISGLHCQYPLFPIYPIIQCPHRSIFPSANTSSAPFTPSAITPSANSPSVQSTPSCQSTPSANTPSAPSTPSANTPSTPWL